MLTGFKVENFVELICQFVKQEEECFATKDAGVCKIFIIKIYIDVEEGGKKNWQNSQDFVELI